MGLNLVKFFTPLSVHKIAPTEALDRTRLNIAAIRRRDMLRKKAKTSCLIRTGCVRNFIYFQVDDVSSITSDSF